MILLSYLSTEWRTDSPTSSLVRISISCMLFKCAPLFSLYKLNYTHYVWETGIIGAGQRYPCLPPLPTRVIFYCVRSANRYWSNAVGELLSLCVVFYHCICDAYTFMACTLSCVLTFSGTDLPLLHQLTQLNPHYHTINHTYLLYRVLGSCIGL